MPRRKAVSTKQLDIREPKPEPRTLEEAAKITAEDMEVLNMFIHDETRSDSLRLNALKVKVAREAALLKEKLADRAEGLNITVQSLDEGE